MRNPLATLLLTLPLLAGAQVSPPVNAPPAPVQPQEPVQTQDAEPPSTLPPPPETAPPPPPAEVSAPPEPTAPPQAERVNVPPTDGQWVYTAQYGWVWMPFGSQFIHVPPGGPPLMFVFYPPVGWRWVVAPWLWGLGTQPYWGVHGINGFPWWGHGVGRWYAFGSPYVTWGARYWWNGSRWVPTTRVYPAPRVVARSPHRFPPRGWPRHRHRW